MREGGRLLEPETRAQSMKTREGEKKYIGYSYVEILQEACCYWSSCFPIATMREGKAGNTICKGMGKLLPACGAVNLIIIINSSIEK